MKIKYKGLILCFIALVFLHFGQVWFYHKQVMTKTIQQQKERAFLNEKEAITTWIMGDSHPLLDVDPTTLSLAFNWAGTSENYVLNYFKIKHLLSKYRKPIRILLSAEYHSFSAQGMELLLQHELDDGFWANKINANELARVAKNSRPIRWKLAAQWFPYAGQYYRGLTSWFQKEETIRFRGWLPNEEVFDNNPLKNKLLASKIESHAGRYQMVDSVQLHFLLKIIGLCQQENIQLQIVRYPLHPQYRNALGKKTDLARIDQIFNTVFGETPVLDFRNLYDGQTQFFSDPDHLNHEGAQDFSEILAKQMEKK